jgi:NADH-quinone oxidoreductase subunit N
VPPPSTPVSSTPAGNIPGRGRLRDPAARSAFGDAQRRWIGVLAVLSLLVTAVLAAMQPVTTRVVALGDMFELDRMAQVLKVVTLTAHGGGRVRLFDRLSAAAGDLKGEYFVLGLFATLGILVLISAASLITLYLGLELMSLCLYAMVAFDRESGRAAESAIKFFVLGSHGLRHPALRHVDHVRRHGQPATGRDRERPCTTALAANVGMLFGIAFIIVGVGFKFGAVPFHMWIPDVYEGSPTCVTLFIGSAPKIAAFALIMRLLPEGWVLAAGLEPDAGGACGAVDGDRQRGRDRAEQSQAHAGVLHHLARRIHSAREYLSGTAQGYQAAMFYTITYVIVATGSSA